MIKKLNVLLLVLVISAPIFAQRTFSGAKLVSTIEANKWDKEKMLTYYEKNFKDVAQREFPNLQVTEVKINRTTGEVSVIGKNAKGKIETISGSDIGTQATESGNSAAMGFFSCLFRKLTFRDCDDAASAPAPPVETPEEAELRRRTQEMMHG